jgi:broad specificity phosphatase PhoE
MTEFLFVRHGETDANAAGTWHGWSDSPLNVFGRAQAEALARRLAAERGQIQALYTSPLRRAFQTARALGRRLALQPIVVDELKEIHFGELEGVTPSRMEEQFPDLYAQWQDRTDMAFQWPGGERRAAFFRRVSQACRRIGAHHEKGEIVIVAHGGTIRACLADLLPDLLGEWWGYELDNGGLSRVRLVDDEARLLALNDTTHLLTDEENSSPMRASSSS